MSFIPTPDISQYTPENIRKDAAERGKSEIRAGTEQLINSSPTAKMLKDTADEIKSTALKGVPLPTSLSSVASLDFKDGQQIAEQVVANLLRANGLPASKKDVKDILEKKAEELAAEGLEYLSAEISEAFGQYGSAAFFSEVASQFAGYAGFVTTSANAIEDGKLTQGEIMGIGMSAMSTASSMMASGAVATGLGVVGAIFAPVAIGIAYFEAVNKAKREFDRKIQKLAAGYVVQERDKIEAYLGGAEYECRRLNKQLWTNKEHAVEEITNQWELIENLLGGGQFGMRFFPGSVTPIRAGWNVKYYSQPGGHAVSKFKLGKVNCTNPSGCDYFPHSDMYLPSHVTDRRVARTFEETERTLRLSLNEGDAPDLNFVSLNPHQYPSVGDEYGNNLQAYWRTIRVFDSFFPYDSSKEWNENVTKDNKLKLAGKFWLKPGHPGRDKISSFKTYEDFARDWLGYSGRDAINALQDWYAHMIEHYRGDFEGGNNPPRMNKRAVDYVKERYDEVQENFLALNSLTTRVQGDLIQTGAAVAGEQATFNRLVDLSKQRGLQIGEKTFYASLQQSGSTKILDPDTFKALNKGRVSLGLNNGVLLAGAALAGTAWWLKRSKK